MNKKQKRFFVFGGAFAIASGAVLLTLGSAVLSL